VAGLSSHVRLIDSIVFLLLIADGVSNRDLVSADSKYKASARTEASSGVILLLLLTHSRQMDRALVNDEPHHRSHGILWRDRSHHVNMVGQEMPFFNEAFFLLGQPSENLAQMPTQVSIEHFAPAFRYEDNVLLAFLLRAA